MFSLGTGGQPLDTSGQPPSASRPAWLFPRGVAGVRAMVQVGAEHGVRARNCLSRSGIDEALLADDSTRVHGDQELTVAHNLVRATGNPPGLGLEVGDRLPLRAYGVLGFALLTSATLREAAAVALRHLPLTYTTAGIRLDERPGEVHLVVDEAGVPRPLRRFVVERELAVIRTILDTILGEPLTPIRVDLRFPRPDGSVSYEAVAGAPVAFGAARNAIVADAAVLDRRLPQSEPHTMRVCERECAALLASQLDGAVAARVRDVLLHGPDPRAEMVDVAARLHMSTRTLHRRLAAEGTSYRRLLDEVRQILAMDLLTAGGLGVEQVAVRLGYADAAAFIRAFRRWTGTTPGSYRVAADRGVSPSGG